MISLILVFGLSLVIKESKSQGFDAGEADPLGFGLIDPVSLEIAATYVFIVPFVIFLVGILVIPASLVIMFLIAQPIFVPTDLTEGRRRKRSIISNSASARRQNLVDYVTDLLMKSQCMNRVMCEVNQGVNSTHSIQQRKSLRSSQKTLESSKTRSSRYKRNRYNCSSEFPCSGFDFFMAIGNAAMTGSRKPS